MDALSVATGPFAALTFIAAPALLTNATSVLALSTTNRMLRTREAMTAMLARSEQRTVGADESDIFLRQVNRTETQAGLMLTALSAIYTALGCFAGATLMTLIGAALMSLIGPPVEILLAVLGLALGATGVACLILGSLKLFGATKLSLQTIREEAALIRIRAQRITATVAGTALPTTAAPATDHLDMI
jgi:hypothetical protein